MVGFGLIIGPAIIRLGNAQFGDSSPPVFLQTPNRLRLSAPRRVRGTQRQTVTARSFLEPDFTNSWGGRGICIDSYPFR